MWNLPLDFPWLIASKAYTSMLCRKDKNDSKLRPILAQRPQRSRRRTISPVGPFSATQLFLRHSLWPPSPGRLCKLVQYPIVWRLGPRGKDILAEHQNTIFSQRNDIFIISQLYSKIFSCKLQDLLEKNNRICKRIFYRCCRYWVTMVCKTRHFNVRSEPLNFTPYQTMGYCQRTSGCLTQCLEGTSSGFWCGRLLPASEILNLPFPPPKSYDFTFCPTA